MSEKSQPTPNESAAGQQESFLTDAAQTEVQLKQEGHQAPEGAKETPVEYAFNLPEGVEGGELLAEFSELAKNHKLGQEDAQAYVDLFQRHQQAQMEKWAEVKAAWLDQVKNDKEIGGTKFEEVKAVVGRALHSMGLPKEFYDLMDQYGIGNHPAFVRGMYRIALQTTEDQPVMSGAGTVQHDPESRMKAMYANSNMT